MRGKASHTVNNEEERPETVADGPGDAAAFQEPSEASGEQPAAGPRTLLFYRRPVPLNRDTHRTLRLRQMPGDYAFAREVNSVPVAAVEFPEACKHYPIVFAGSEPARSIPSVLVGLRADENLFVEPDGSWPHGYVPAFVRRYPFVLAEKPEGDDFTVCVDEEYPGLGSEQGEPLFDEAGKETPPLQRALQFLSEYQGQMQRTRDFVQRLDELSLLQPKVVQVTPREGEPFVLQGVHVIDAERLGRLDDTALRGLFDAGDLGPIYAHLFSLSNVERLTSRLDESRPAARQATP